MGNTHMAQRARMEADSFRSKWRTTNDFAWGYGRERGPDSWWVHYPGASGHHQSPIDINPEEAEFDSDLASYPLKVVYPPGQGTKLICNTGHSCQIEVRQTSRSRPFYITGGPMKRQRFELSQFHFHWGDKDECGSEHTVHGRASAMEIHFVHWNVDMFSSYAEAAQSDNGLVVLAVFVKISEESCGALEYISSFLPRIRYKGECDNMSMDFDMSYLLPRDLKKYWVYKGSMTTPPCHESVTWIIFYDPVFICAEDIHKFRGLRTHGSNERPPIDDHRGFIVQNYRPIQPQGTRKITTMEHIFMGHSEFQQQFHNQSLFTTFPEYVCSFHRQGIHD